MSKAGAVVIICWTGGGLNMFREGVWRGFSEAIRGAKVAAAGFGGEEEAISE